MQILFYKNSIGKRIIASVSVLSFLITGVFGFAGPVVAQEFLLPQPGALLNLSPAFTPPLLKGVKVHPDNPFRLDFILDKGNSAESIEELKTESTRLIKYFLASVTVSENDLWVNLSPYEKDRIIPNAFGVTEMGRDLLAQDYILKQLTASVIYPEEKIGKEFWDRVYEEARKRYGTADIPIDTFNKVWIVPAKATIYETKDSAYVVESRLKVLLEEDYLALEKGTIGQSGKEKAKESNKLGSDIVREIVIPILEKEVNEGKNFVQLRQVYQSLILAIWFKDKIRESLFGKVYVDQEKTGGVDIADKAEKNKIWERYVEAFKKGAYNYIKEDYDPATEEIVARKYFSGGAGLNQIRQVYGTTIDQAKLPEGVTDSAMVVQVKLDAAETLSGDEQTWLQTIITPAVFQQMAPQDLYWAYRVLTLGHGSLEVVQGLQKEAGNIEEKPRIFISRMETKEPEEGRTIYLRLHKSIVGASGSERKIFRFKGARPRVRGEKIEDYPANGMGGDGVGPVIRDGNVLTEGRRDEGSLDRKKGTMAANRAQHEYEVMTGSKSGGYPTDDPVGWGERNVGDQGDKMAFAIAAMDGGGDIRLWFNEAGRLELYDFEKSDIDGEKIQVDEEVSRQIYKEIGKAVRSFHRAGYVHQVLSFTNIGIRATGREGDPYRAVLRDLDIALRLAEDPNQAANQRLLDLWRILKDLTAHIKNPDTLKRAFLDGYFDKEKGDPDFNSLEEEVLSKSYYKCAYYFNDKIIDWMELGTAVTTRFNILKDSYLEIIQSMWDMSVRNFNKSKEELYEIREEPNPLRWTVHFLRMAEGRDAAMLASLEFSGEMPFKEISGDPQILFAQDYSRTPPSGVANFFGDQVDIWGDIPEMINIEMLIREFIGNARREAKNNVDVQVAFFPADRILKVVTRQGGISDESWQNLTDIAKLFQESGAEGLLHYSNSKVGNGGGFFRKLGAAMKKGHVSLKYSKLPDASHPLTAELLIALPESEDAFDPAMKTKESSSVTLSEIEEQEQGFYQTAIDWVKYIFDNYELKFKRGKLVFIGGASRRAFEAANYLAESDLYPQIKKRDVIYLDATRSARVSGGIVQKFLKGQGVLENNRPVVLLDNWADSGGQIARIKSALETDVLSVIAYTMVASAEAGVRSYESDVPSKAQAIREAGVFFERNNHMIRDVRSEMLVDYQNVGDGLHPEYFTVSEAAEFLGIIGDGEISEDSMSREMFLWLRQQGVNFAFRDASASAKAALQRFVEENPPEDAVRQEKMFRKILSRDNSQQTPGGIDLTRDRMDIQIQNKGQEVQFNFDSAMIEQLQNASGLTPVIINIYPMTTTVPIFLGLKDDAQEMASVR